MSTPTAYTGTYAEQIRRLAQTLASSTGEALRDTLAVGSTPLHVELFLESTYEKRMAKLEQQLLPMTGTIGELRPLLEAYRQTLPQSAYEDVITDSEGFLGWLQRTRHLTPEQRDHVACLRARHSVEQQARERRLPYIRFQELWSVAGTLAEELGMNPDLRIHLNPLHAWAQFRTTALLDGETSLPATLLFYPVSGEVRTALLEPSGRAAVHVLDRLGTCTLDEWEAESRDAERDELVSMGRDLAAIGLVAFS